MPDREKVIKGLKCCFGFDEDWFYHCGECPYRATEDERKVIDWCCHLEDLRSDALELLKGQEPVEPIPPTDESDLWRCGNCNHQLFKCKHQRYCEMCGREVKWDE